MTTVYIIQHDIENLLNKIETKINDTYESLEKKTLIKIINILTYKNKKIKDTIMNISADYNQIEKEYLIISLNSIYSELSEKKYIEKTITNNITLYKYIDYYTIFINGEISIEKNNNIIKKIKEISPKEIIITNKNSKKKILIKYSASIDIEKDLIKYIKKNSILKLITTESETTYIKNS